MDIGEIAVGLYLTLVGGSLSALTWSRLHRIEHQIAELRAEQKADNNGLRSDLTLVALAVGVERPKPHSV